MKEKTRKRLVFVSLGFAVVYGAVNLLPLKENTQKLSKLSTVSRLKADQERPPARSLINIDSMTSLNWGSDPFRIKEKITLRESPARKSSLGWRLSGILYSGNNPMAIINKKMVRTGDTVDKAKVISIKRKHVVLEYNGRKQTLTVSRG